uniref:erythroid differentiation-related factor 1 n=1 Tax=Ciona intestinalis TaxID=7719 RepID=UPI000180C716|nr:erythroid differentiation-related factor 1 [Ciona intestinalis]|eukprot:XP_002119713.1 erythroid differentiation-related factor 1 [Ciona intestinalis]
MASGTDSSQPKTVETEVRSRAVVTYSAAKFPAFYNQLAPLTNLNLAPSNWLRRAQGLRPSHLISGSRPCYSDPGRRDMPLFTSFSMADKHLDIIGKIDVVSDAENIKKLLKMPFSKAQISMAVHRVGKTLLLEQFDFASRRPSETEPGWFGNIQQQLSNIPSLPKKKLPSAQHERLMLSKFLYYSIHANEQGTATERPPSPPSSETHSVPDDIDVMRRIEEVVRITPDATDSTDNSLNAVVPSELRWKFWTPGSGSFKQQDISDTFERTICWSFEDLQMLLGTNMPIFGGGEYPAVSLRLRDSSKPINVLTGIDYWLDNLICNVPEVVMCFHVNGIVKNYEVIRTEDIPTLEGSRFRPKVIKDIAQNILSFLKSNCTKEGHTYWLFKGSNEDDVVKLYDLTMLCDQKKNRGDENSHNPFTLSVATLLYKMAVNLMQQASVACSSKATIKELLKNCINLLEKNSSLDPVMLMGALCMLSTLCLPDSPSEKPPVDLNKKDRQKSNLSLKSHTVEKPNMEVAVIPSVTELSIPEKYRIKLISESNQVETDGCHSALTHIIQALNVRTDEDNDPELLEVRIQLYRNISLAYYSLAEHESKQENYGLSLQFLRIALQSYEFLEYLMTISVKQAKQGLITPPDFHLLLPRLLTLCGDIQWNRSQSKSEDERRIFCEQFFSVSDTEIAVCDAMNKFTVISGQEYVWLTDLQSEVGEGYKTTRQCYQSALEKLPNKRKDKKSSSSKMKAEDRGKSRSRTSEDEGMVFMIKRKLGHVANEQGALGIGEAVTLLNVTSYKDKDKHNNQQKEVWKMTYSHLELALNCFTVVNDAINQALVLSNLGKLMRICAQSIAQDQQDNFTMDEETLHNRAIDYYLKALTHHNSNHDRRNDTDTSKSLSLNIHNNLSWEVCGAYFTMAQRVQDHSPLHLKSREQIEQQTSDLLHKSLKHCNNILKSNDKKSQAIMRCAKIHHRLASLHHNSFRNVTESTKRRHCKTLADSHYDKAILFFHQLPDESSTDYFRILLEKLALHENCIETHSTTNPTTKVKQILETLGLSMPCMRPLSLLHELLQDFIRHNSDSSSPVDLPDTRTTDLQITSSSIDEWTSLSNVLSTVLQSLLLMLVKCSGTTRTTAKKRPTAPSTHPAHTKYKELYTKSLHCLTVCSKDIDKTSSLNKHKYLLERVKALLAILNETKIIFKK